jgi:hypothetical protein
MKNLKIITILTIILLSFGCSGNNDQNAPPDNSALDTVHQKQHESIASEEQEVAGKLVLNNGNKWRANTESTEGIQKMLILINGYLSKGDTDNKALIENLEKEFTTILQKCSMNGEGHTQLHNYLLPLKGKIDKLKDNPDFKSLKDIQSYLNDYKNYFQ